MSEAFPLEFVRSLGKHVESGGMVVCWCSDSLGNVRNLLDSLPTEKPSIRVISRSELTEIMAQQDVLLNF